MRWLLLLVLALGVGAAGFWALGGRDPAPPPGPVADADTAPPADGEAEHGEPWDDAGDEFDPASDDTGSADGDVERIEVDDGPEAGPRRALVVRGDPPVPVPDVEVLFVDEGEQARRLRGTTPPPKEQWPERWGRIVRTGADGTAPLPETRGTLLVAARSEGEFGYASLRRQRRTVTLRLQPDERLVLRVRREGGEPATAVPLAVQQWRGRGRPHRAFTGTSDDRGELVIPHFQEYRRAPQDPAQERFAALALVPGPQPVVVGFEGRPVTAEPVELQLPATGDLELVLTDHQGKPLLSPAWLTVLDAAVPELREPFPIDASVLARHERKPAGEQVVLVPYVAAGADLRAYAHFENDRKGASAALRGPDRDGATVRVRLPLGDRQALLAGRVVRADGTPFGPARLQAVLWRGERDVATVHLHTLADGRFDVVLLGRDEPPPFVLHVRETEARGPDQPLLGARVPLAELTGGRRIELGDVVLGELPPLVAGVVVDDVGAPVRGADLQVQGHRPERRRGDPWQALPGLATRTGEDGTFALHGDLPPGELRLLAESRAHFDAHVALHTPGQRVELRLERFGIVRGRAQLPDWLADEATTLLLRPIDEARQKEWSRTVPLRRRGGGRFVVAPLHAGRYDAIVQVRNVRGPVLVVADVFVQPGTNDDPRLADLDLRRALFRYRLRAVDAAGQTVAFDGPIQAQLAMPDGEVVEAGFRWEQGRAELITPGTQAELLFFGRGFLPQRLAFGPGDHDVFLPPLRPALLELPGARALCGPVRKVRVSVILTESTGYPESLGGVDQRTGRRFSFPRWDLGRSSGAWLERYDTVEVPLMKSGRYEVVLRVHATESTRTPQASVSLGVFDLQADTTSLVPVQVPVDAAAVERACAEVDERWRAQQQERPR